MLDDVNVHGSFFSLVWIFFFFVQTHYHSLPCQKSYPFSQWEWLWALQLLQGKRMPLQILKAMPERNICSQGSKQKNYAKDIIIIILIFTKSTKKSTLLAYKQALWGTLVMRQNRRESALQSLLAGYTS